MVDKIYEVENLSKRFLLAKKLFGGGASYVGAVDDLSFSIYRGETLGIVGESGCGKSTTGRLLLKLIEPSEGKIRFEGKDLSTISGRDVKALRRDVQMVFQDPSASLNPRMKIKTILEEPLITHGIKVENKQKKIGELLEAVGLFPGCMSRFPHEFSGGQRQRIGIARALALNPKFIVADEPVASLDVSIQAQIINLLQQIQKEFGLTYLFIAHDLSVIQHVSDRVGVMYLGQMVELTTRQKLFKNPLHPYTRALLDAIPVPDPKKRSDKPGLVGEIPSPINPPGGCRFHPRCPLAAEKCSEEKPRLIQIGPEHQVACFMVKKEEYI
jgi:oligopeptide transport system ATP-binding protein